MCDQLALSLPLLRALEDCVTAMEDELEANGIYPFSDWHSIESLAIQQVGTLTTRLVRLASTLKAAPSLAELKYPATVDTFQRMLSKITDITPYPKSVYIATKVHAEQLSLFEINQSDDNRWPPSPRLVTAA